MSAPKYELVYHDNQFHKDHWCIKITEGRLEGIVFQYDVVRVEEDEEDMYLTFNTITIEHPNDKSLNIINEEDQYEEFGQILTDIIRKDIERQAEESDKDE